MRLVHSRFAVALALAFLFAFSGPGVGVARADADLAPSADELFGSASPARVVPLPTGAACNPASVERAQERRRQIGQQLAELMMRDDGDGPGRALRNGHGYQMRRDPMFELRRVEAEAARQRAAR